MRALHVVGAHSFCGEDTRLDPAVDDCVPKALNLPLQDYLCHVCMLPGVHRLRHAWMATSLLHLALALPK